MSASVGRGSVVGHPCDQESGAGRGPRSTGLVAPVSPGPIGPGRPSARGPGRDAGCARDRGPVHRRGRRQRNARCHRPAVCSPTARRAGTGRQKSTPPTAGPTTRWGPVPPVGTSAVRARHGFVRRSGGRDGGATAEPGNTVRGWAGSAGTVADGALSRPGTMYKRYHSPDARPAVRAFRRTAVHHGGESPSSALARRGPTPPGRSSRAFLEVRDEPRQR